MAKSKGQRYAVVAYSRYSARDDKTAKLKTNLTARAAAKLAVQYARGKGIDAGVAVRRADDLHDRVGSTGYSAYSGDVLMRCRSESPEYRRANRQAVVKCEVTPEFKRALKER